MERGTCDVLYLPTPCPLAPHPCGRLQSFGTARTLLRLSLALGPMVLGHTYIPRLQSEVCDGFHVFLVLEQYFRIVVIMRLRILATIAIDPLFEMIRTIVAIKQLHQPAKQHRHKQRPATHHHGYGPCKCIFLLALNLSPGPLWVHPQ